LVEYSQSYGLNEVCDNMQSSNTVFVRTTGVELPGESSVYKYALEYVTTHLLEEFSENRIRLLEGYSILYIQVSLTIECSKGQGQECRSRQLIKCYVIII